MRGVGGTRNCDWWFTDEAVFLDTAGRYTTQDSDASSDSEGWREFLALLTKYRQRRPVNGIILTISAQDLLTQGDAGREAHVDAARRRLTELTRELQIQLPVYVMVTKCDMVAGFTEYFDDLTQEDRAQVWGVTFPYEDSVNGEAADAFPAEFDALMGRLNERVFARLEEERGRPTPRQHLRLSAADGGAARSAHAVRERHLFLDVVQPADPAARRVPDQRHAGRHADRSAAGVHRPPLRRRRRRRGARRRPRQGVLHGAAAQAGGHRRVGACRCQPPPRDAERGVAARGVRGDCCCS